MEITSAPVSIHNITYPTCEAQAECQWTLTPEFDRRKTGPVRVPFAKPKYLQVSDAFAVSKTIRG